MKQVLFTLLLLTAPAAADSEQPVVEKAKLEVQPAGKAFKTITIANPLGDVVVEGYDGTALRIESRKVAPEDIDLDRLRISLVPNPDGTVRIETRADKVGNDVLARGSVRIDLKVYAPRDARIEATSSSGAVRISNLDNGGEIDTASGTIEVSNVSGELQTSSVNGSTTIQQVFGTIDSQTLDADLAFDSIAGEKLIASANRGKITGRRVRSREVQLTAHHGSISLEAEAMLRGRIVVASLKGDVEVKLRRPAQLAMVARAHGGKVNLGGMTTAMQQDGWQEARIGNAQDKTLPMLVEMRSRVGYVRLVLVP